MMYAPNCAPAETGFYAARPVAALFCRPDSIYKTLPGVDAFDIDRDARGFLGGVPVVAHPPCRAWGALRGLAKPRHDEKDLARFAVRQVRRCGGVLEHPARSTLWADQGLPVPGRRDEFGGWTLPILQHDFGHKADKATWLYIVGVEPCQIPDLPQRLGEATHVVSPAPKRKDGTRNKRRPELSKAAREHTPEELARWLVRLARSVKRPC